MKRLEMPPRALLNLFVAGAMIRIVGIVMPHSLWLDEGATWSNATQPSWGETLTAEANHPPLWWLITRLWFALFGEGSEAALRAPAVFFGILTLPLLWLVGRQLFVPSRRPARGGFDRTGDDAVGERMAVWFTGLAAGAAYLIEYSQEARMYALLIFETVLLTWLYLRWLDRSRTRDAVFYAIVACLTLHTQYFGLWPICAHGAHVLYLWWRGRGTEEALDPRPIVFAIIAAGLCFVPWAIYFVSEYRGIATGSPPNPVIGFLHAFWRFGVGPAIFMIDRARQGTGIEHVPAGELAVIILTVLCWFPALLRGFWALFRHRGVASLLGFSLLVPMGLLVLIFPWFQLIHERYVCFLAPWIFALAVLGAFDTRGVVRHFLLGGLVVLTLLGLVVFNAADHSLVLREEQVVMVNGERETYPKEFGSDPADPLRALHFGHAYGKAPWKEAHRFVAAQYEEGDVVVLYPHYLHLVWDFYDRGQMPQVRVPLDRPGAEALRREILPRLQAYKRVFVVFGSEDAVDPKTGLNASDDVMADLWEALDEAWMAQGSPGARAVPPILFNRSWGVRVAIIQRR